VGVNGAGLDVRPRRCLNCDAPLTGPYCATCGQKPPHPDLTLRDLVAESTHELTHWDGKVIATLKALLLRPGLLTSDFLAGRRARWLPPLRVYLICSVAYFVSEPLVETVTQRSTKQVARITLSTPRAQDPARADVVRPDSARPDSAPPDTAGLHVDPEAQAAVDSAWITRVLGKERIERIIAEPQTFNDALAASFPKAMFILMPMFAFLTWLAWRRTGIRYPAHLYFALHLHAAGFASMVLSKVTSVAGSLALDIAIALGLVAYGTWYTIAAARRVYGGSGGDVTLRMTLVGVAYSVLFMVVMLGLIGYTLMTA